MRMHLTHIWSSCRVAAVEKAEAAKINVVKAAEADAEAKFLQGQVGACTVARASPHQLLCRMQFLQCWAVFRDAPQTCRYASAVSAVSLLLLSTAANVWCRVLHGSGRRSSMACARVWCSSQSRSTTSQGEMHSGCCARPLSSMTTGSEFVFSSSLTSS
jgi:hypothetical protein